jgi:hypothetical protein
MDGLAEGRDFDYEKDNRTSVRSTQARLTHDPCAPQPQREQKGSGQRSCPNYSRQVTSSGKQDPADPGAVSSDCVTI